jgi:rare lipoprotein A
MNTASARVVLALAATLLSGCAHKKTVRRVPVAPPPAPTARSTPPAATRPGEVARTPAPIPPPPPTLTPDGQPIAPLYVEKGKASWYGHPYHGRQAANGEIYDMEKLTAAHRTLPFNTWVHVVNVSNEKAVDVRITDRGPFVGGRIIDLSHAAARAIELIGPGVAEVRVEIMSMPENARSSGHFAVQVGAFQDKSNAERERARLATKYGATKLVFREGNPSLWRVLVGSEKTEDGATELRRKILKDSGERNAFVIRLDS